MKSKVLKSFIALFLICFLIIVFSEIFGYFLKFELNKDKEDNSLIEINNNEEINIDNPNIQENIIEANDIAVNEKNKNEKISNNTDNNENVIVKDSHIKINVIGDIMCHNTQYFDAFDTNTQNYDFSYVFEDVKEATSNADLFIGNLETTFAGKERGYSNYPNFNTPEQLAYDLKELGIDVLATANNHCMDTGYNGIESTLNFLDDAQILHTGTNRSVEEQNRVLFKDINGIKIAFLAFTYGTNGIPVPKDKNFAVNIINENFILSQIENAKLENPDIICVSMHWGIEYQMFQNSEQERLADFLIKNGVNIILGSHPHVLQPMEIREVELENGEKRNGFVIYSLGNFMSGQTQKATRTSIILNLDITKKAENNQIYIDDISYIPIYTYTSSIKPKYKILNIEKSIEKYESGEDISIGESNYLLFKSEIDRVKELLK